MLRRHFIRSVLWAAALGVSAAGHAADAPKVLVVGDSLSAEYGLARGTGWVALLTQKLQADKVPAQVVNASISGDTTAGGRARLPALLKTHQPKVVVIELGSNDALRGLSLQATQANLTAMTQAAQQAGAKVLLIGMQMPPNYGAAYGKQFSDLFGQVAKANGAALVPFMLKGVADQADALKLFQADRIHPTAEAHPTILANIYPSLRKMLP
ncbi:arylesterase [Ottowia oryzae]|uniref:Arylesterase n=1 Tax=Ottowia oryzae TaxID=2109914 RepID=A0A2S0MI34_9BURK|nr:arylesterase [Ottowia oryzae]